MSKPLELTIYPPRAQEPLPSDPDWQGWDAWREWRRIDDREFHQRRAARLTEAELAAEYWAPIFIHFPDPTVWDRDYEGTSAEMSRRSATLHRFASSPHYFETDQ